ncbi:MAG: radical SAM protein [Phycisphaeraceae bacterium]|nr:radical SAM protein [Phycisphaeraceae bacterium]
MTAGTSIPKKRRVNRIQRFCIHDGPGIRTTVFTQGCTLRCWWCHNPDTKPRAHANSRLWEIDTLLDQLSTDERYWKQSHGGITVSGGEPLMQIRPMLAFLEQCGKRGWHRTIETAGAVPLTSIQQASKFIDLWLWDIKATDAARFTQGTQGDSQQVLNNLRWLLEQNQSNVIIRMPLINGFNAQRAAWEAIAHDLKRMPRTVPLFILPGHECGTTPADCPTSPRVDPLITQQACDNFIAHGIDANITW